MNNKELVGLITDLDEHLSLYAQKFNSENVVLVNKLKDQYILTNERTLAAVSNVFIKEYFKNRYKSQFKLSVDEFYIKFIDKNIPANLKQTVGGKVHKDKWKLCTVDGYFKVDNLYFLKTNHLFVEYKLKHKFAYMDLATDFLKYKIYTSLDESNTIFAFILFDKNIHNPSIIKHNAPIYTLLTKNITISSVAPSGVFIYLPPTNYTYDDKRELILDLYQEFDNFSELSLILEELGDKSFEEYSEFDKALLANSSKYNKKVFTSSLIRANFPYVREVWDLANSTNVFDAYKKEIGFKDNDTEILIKLIEDGSHHYKNFEGNTVGDSKVRSANEGMRASVFSSFKLLVLIDYFAEVNKISSQPPKYPKTTTQRGNRNVEINYAEVAKTQKQKLAAWYASETNKLIIDKLAFQIMYFLINVYPLFFVLDEKFNVKEKTINKQIHDTIDKMQLSLNRISSLIKYNDKINILNMLEAEEDIEGRFSNILEYLLKILL